MPCELLMNGGLRLFDFREIFSPAWTFCSRLKIFLKALLGYILLLAPKLGASVELIIAEYKKSLSLATTVNISYKVRVVKRNGQKREYNGPRIRSDLMIC